MSKSTRSKSKQARMNSKPVSNVANSTVKKDGASSNGAAAKTTSALSNGASVKTDASSTAPASTTQKSAMTLPKSTTQTTQKATTTQSKPSTTTAKASSGRAAKQPDAASRPYSKSAQQQRKQQKMQNRLTQQRQDKRTQRTTIFLVAAALIAAAGLLAYFLVSNSLGSQAHTVFDPDYPPIDNAVYCDQLEQTAYHHHVLLTIYIDGQQVTVPAAVGLAGSPTSPTCYYWLHTHDTTGIIHIEAPSGGSFSLKEFLDVWQSFANTGSSSSTITYPSQLASSAGWTVYINGKKVNEDFSHVDISSNQAWHELITIMYNSPNAKPTTTYSWPAGY